MPSLTGATQDEVRRSNLSAVLRMLHTAGPQTRSHLTAVTGLNRSTVGDLVSSLAALGLVRERPGDVRGVGRPSLVVEPIAGSVAVLALDLRVERTVAALVGLGGEVFARVERRHSDQDRDALIDEAGRACEEALDSLPAGGVVVGVCVGVPGVVRATDGLVRFAPNLGWTDVPLGDMLGERLGRRDVAVRNDADLGVLAEHLRGSARDSSTVLYLAGDIGVGGGVFVDGRPLIGAGGYGGEVGHMRVNPGGHTCRCGATGCWETEIGYAALARASGVAARGGLPGLLEAMERGDARVMAAFASVAEWLGVGLVNLVNMLNPQSIVLGGHLGDVYAVAGDRVHAQLAGALPASRDQVRIAASELGSDAPLVGAAEVAFTSLLEDPAGVSRQSRLRGSAAS
jgi:predicted NBD/HSP70 family sugar kinase